MIRKSVCSLRYVATWWCFFLFAMVLGISVMLFNLREFGVQTTVIAAPLRWVGLLPAVLGPGPPGPHVARTLRFSRLMV